ncbi:MAG TPA: periplasmic heavy metal sensor [Vicinamibacterales bacterium]|nr:periplasmic heavy metal sensor [Vicinamibacterales bacterium]
MDRRLSWVFAALLFLCAPTAGAAELCDTSQQRPGQPPAGRNDRPGDKPGKPGDHEGHEPLKWWIDPKLRAELGVTDQQSAAVEQIWQKSVPGLREARSKLDKLEEALTQLTRDDSVDEAQVIAQIERIENMRADANKRRTLMIYRMNKILTPDQRTKVKALFERRDAQRRGASPR